MKLGETKFEILLVIKGLCTHNIRTFCWPSRDKMLILLNKHYNKKISLSALDQHLKDLRDDKFILSHPQKGQKEDGTWYNKVSNRQLTKKGVFYLLKRGIRITQWLITWAKKRILPKAERKSYNISKLNKEAAARSGILSEDIQKWMDTPGLKLDPLKLPS